MVANNELFYRTAREALTQDLDIQQLIDDLDAAVESYLTELSEDDGMTEATGREVKHAYAHALAFADNLRAWLAEMESS